MICGACKRGGVTNSKPGRELDTQQWHKACKGCDCQHKTGNWIQSNTDRPMESVK